MAAAAGLAVRRGPAGVQASRALASTSVFTENGCRFSGSSGYSIGEIVHQLFDPDGVFRRALSHGHEAPDVRVRRAIDVHRKGGERIVASAEERIVDDPIVRLGVVDRPIPPRQALARRHGRAAAPIAGFAAVLPYVAHGEPEFLHLGRVSHARDYNFVSRLTSTTSAKSTVTESAPSLTSFCCGR